MQVPTYGASAFPKCASRIVLFSCLAAVGQSVRLDLAKHVLRSGGDRSRGLDSDPPDVEEASQSVEVNALPEGAHIQGIGQEGNVSDSSLVTSTTARSDPEEFAVESPMVTALLDLPAAFVKNSEDKAQELLVFLKAVVGDAQQAVAHRLKYLHDTDSGALQPDEACWAYSSPWAKCSLATCHDPPLVGHLFGKGGIAQVLESADSLIALGSLAKAGNFFATPDKSVLVKAIKGEESAVLRSWSCPNERYRLDMPRTGYKTCAQFMERSLLVSMPLHVRFGGVPYIVMPNMKTRVVKAAQDAWGGEAVSVLGSYDIKPLPNLAPDLATLLRALRLGWHDGNHTPAPPQLEEWGGYSILRAALRKDLQTLLSYGVVDYSILLTVMRVDGLKDGQHLPLDLQVTGGCMIYSNPSPKDGRAYSLFACLCIIDFLTPYTWVRGFESWKKKHKFDGYADKMLLAYICLGNPDHAKCREYIAYSKVIGVDMDPRSAFLTTVLFRENYQCTVEEPRLQLKLVSSRAGVFVKQRMIIPEMIRLTTRKRAPPGNESQKKQEPDLDAPLRLLQDLASPDLGTRVLGDAYTDLFRPDYYADVPFGKTQIEVCRRGVEKFATATHIFAKSRHKDLKNMLWAPQENVVMAVRGEPAIGSHRGTLLAMVQEGCHLFSHFFRCRPLNGPVVTDHKHTFKGIEVLVLSMDTLNKRTFDTWLDFYHRQLKTAISLGLVQPK